MRKRLLVTGGRGFVAGSLLTQAGRGWEVYALSRGLPPRVLPEGIEWRKGDYFESEALGEVFAELRPQSVIHAAAIAGIDYCEAHRDAARRANTEWTARIASQCAQYGARLVFLSTDNVFDGQKGGYREADAPAPVNYYGDTKVQAERLVLDALEDAVIARVSLVMGVPLLGEGNSFLSRMAKVLRDGERLGVPAEELRSPIDVVSAGRALLELADGAFTGVLHLAGNDVVGRYAMAQRLAERLGFDAGLIFANDPTEIPGRAERPLDVSLSNMKARSLLATPMLGLEEGLDLVLQESGGL